MMTERSYCLSRLLQEILRGSIAQEDPPFLTKAHHFGIEMFHDVLIGILQVGAGDLAFLIRPSREFL